MDSPKLTVIPLAEMKEMTWKHPTGKTPSSVSLIGLGHSLKDWISMCLEPEPNSITLTEEVWVVNRGSVCLRHDLAFVMDHIQGEAERYPEYGRRLRQHDRPIITSDTAGGWPEHVYEFPFQAIETWLQEVVRPSHSDWFHNSVAYIMVYAAYIGVREMRVWGADYQNHTSGQVENGHANVAYWVGVLEKIGLIVKPINSSHFLGANQRDYLYGYRGDPRQEARQRRERWRQLHAGTPLDLL